MKAGMKKFFQWIVFLLVVFGMGYVLFFYYGYVFSKTIEGRVLAIRPAEEEEGFVIAVRKKDGKIYTTKAKDSQWSLVNPDQCVRARLLPYPPWNLKYSDTYYGAVLVHLRECLPEEMEGLQSSSMNMVLDRKANEDKEKPEEAPVVLEEEAKKDE